MRRKDGGHEERRRSDASIMLGSSNAGREAPPLPPPSNADRNLPQRLHATLSQKSGTVQKDKEKEKISAS
jgi:hypothetical protein